ncbi:hypothetical protein Tco_0700703 [Tanacetum coccineum]
MSNLKFAETHNLVAFLEKPKESDGFEGIIDFLNASSIRYALTVSPTIYTSCIKQFWATAKAKTINGEVQIQALVDGKKVIVTETSVRRALQLKDAEGTECLPNATIFEQQHSWGMKILHKSLHSIKLSFHLNGNFLSIQFYNCLSAKTTAWNEFSSTMASTVICLATNQKFDFSMCIFDNMVKNLEGGVKFLMYPKFVKVFLDKKGKDFSSRDTPLFPTMIVQAQEQVGGGSKIRTDSHRTPTTTQPSTFKPQKKQSRRNQRKDTEDPQLSGPIKPVPDDTENVVSVPTHSNDPLLSEITELKKRVKKFEGKRKSKPPWMRRLYKVTLVDETQGRNDEEMFDTGILDGEEVFAEQDVVEKEVSTTEVTTDCTTTTTIDELTLARTLIEIKAAKPKAVTTAATTATTAVTKPKARGVVVQEPNAELEEEEKLARQREEDANIAEWDNVQAMMDADYELDARLQAEEQGELTIEEKSRLFVELMNKRKKHFARLRAEEQRRKPPSKAQKKNTMSTYLKNMARYKHNQLKTKSFEDIQMLFDKAMKRVNTFVDMDTELVKGSETRTGRSSKRAGEELESKNLKKQKLDENVEAEVDNDQEETEMKKNMEIVPDDEVAIDAIPLATKPPIIVDKKIIKEGKMGYF